MSTAISSISGISLGLGVRPRLAREARSALARLGRPTQGMIQNLLEPRKRATGTAVLSMLSSLMFTAGVRFAARALFFIASRTVREPKYDPHAKWGPRSARQ